MLICPFVCQMPSQTSTIGLTKIDGLYCEISLAILVGTLAEGVHSVDDGRWSQGPCGRLQGVTVTSPP